MIGHLVAMLVSAVAFFGAILARFFCTVRFLRVG